MKRVGGLVLCGLLAACDAPPPLETQAPAETQAPTSTTTTSTVSVDVCEQKRAAAMKEPAVPGNAAFEKDRSAYIGRVRGASLLWKREPKEKDGDARAVRELESAGRALRAVRDVIHQHRKRPERLRALFLREGYFYVRGVDTAVAAVQQLGLAHLFETPTLRLMRDGAVVELTRKNNGYMHEDGERAELLFGDRFGDSDDHLAVDFTAAMREHNFERLRIEHLSHQHLVAQARYDGTWVAALFDVSEPAAQLVCQRSSEAYAVSQRRGKVQARVREAVEVQVREKLPFDAPRGKGDPKDKYPLRARWKDAFHKSLKTYEFGGRRYQVYDDEGRPHPPQVCLEFIHDTWERASGTWYGKSGKRIIGGLDMSDLAIKSARRVSHFMDFARNNPDHFDVWTVPEDDRVVFNDHDGFFASLDKHVDKLRLGDMLVVRRPKHGKLARHHTLIVHEVDPISGIPALLAGNAALPRIQTFEGVMQTSPRRYLMWRVRPTEAWLDDAILRQ